MVCGLFGTYFAYCAYRCSGANRGLAVIISYCVPVVVVAVLSYFFLHEQYNRYAVAGVAMIVGGVYLIDRKGVAGVGEEAGPSTNTRALTEPESKR